jgi:NhaA family Na+:H+ antiporter
MLLWLAMHAAGVHATLSGIILALTIPMRGLLGDSDLKTSPLHRLEQRLHPVVAFGVLPLFALANAGVEFPSLQSGAEKALSLPTMLGVGFGLLLGKPLGIFAAAALAIRLRLGELPAQTSYPMLLGAAMLAGIGFTMSIFIAGLAFREPSLLSSAKLGILAGSLGSALLGAGWLGLMSSRTTSTAEPHERP